MVTAEGSSTAAGQDKPFLVQERDWARTLT